MREDNQILSVNRALVLGFWTRWENDKCYCSITFYLKVR